MKNKSFLSKFSWIFMILLGLSVSFSMTSCGDDDDDDDNGNADSNVAMKTDIVGKWQLYNDRGEDSDGEKWNDTYNPETESIVFVFNADGTASQTCYLNGQLEYEDKATYSVSGSTINLNIQEDGYTFNTTVEILKVTPNELVLYSNNKDGDNYWEKSTLTFKRIK